MNRFIFWTTAHCGPQSAPSSRRRRAGSAGRAGTAVLSAVALGGMILPGTAGAATRTAGAAPSVLYVNAASGADRGHCPESAPCASIGYAIRQAASTATINVAQGSYAEQVVVPGGDDLTILGAGDGGPYGFGPVTEIDPTALPVAATAPAGSPVYALVDVEPGAKLVMDHVDVDGTAAQAGFPGTACEDGLAGVWYDDAGGSLGADVVADISLPASQDTCTQGYGVDVTSGPGGRAHVAMKNLLVDDYQAAGIACAGAGTTCDVASTPINGAGRDDDVAQVGVLTEGAQAVTIDGVGVYGDEDPHTPGVGIVLDGDRAATVESTYADDDDIGAEAIGAGSATFEDDNLSHATDRGDGLVIEGTSSVTATHVSADDDAGTGIVLSDASGSTVGNSLAQGDGYGVSVVGGSTGDTVDHTRTRGDTVGLYADHTVSGNTFSSDKASGNSSFADEDASQGSGTEGTADTWTGDSCRPKDDSSPVGLC